MKLSELFTDQQDINIDAIMYDSRDVLENSIFFCLSGLTSDAHKFVNQAISNGAVAIVHSKQLPNYEDHVTYINVADVEKVFVEKVNLFYKEPSQDLWMIGVTGTNGKTTVAHYIKQLLNLFRPTGYIGTLGIEYGKTKHDIKLTTTDLVSTSETLVKMKEELTESVVMELSSHGLEQNRVAGIHFDIGVFTNLSHDHLDFHMTMENYYQAKKQLFNLLEYGKTAIINIDDEYGLRLSNELVISVLTVSFKQEANYRISNLSLSTKQSAFDLTVDGETYHIIASVIGQFNVMNLVQAIAVVHQSGYDISSIIDKLDVLKPIPGRMEVVNRKQPYSLIVDFSQTTEGFERVLKFARSVTEANNRLIVVFGSPGNRDKNKRQLLGQLIERYGDFAILTEDNNRDELVLDICHEIAKSIATKPYLMVENRTEAIRQALTLAKTGDTVLLLGKGDERVQEREQEHQFYLGDRMVAQKIIEEFEKEKELYETIE